MKVPLTLRDFLDRGATVYPDRIAVVDEPDQPAGSLGSVTFSQLAARARAQAAGLDRLGVGPGERVAILSQNSARLLAGFWGVAGWGRIYVPINFRLAAEEISYIVAHCSASVLLYDPELTNSVAGVDGIPTIELGSEAAADLVADDTEPIPWEPDEDVTATINYTSGTTARPKGVQQTHRSLWLNATTFGWQAGITDRDTYLHTLPMFHCNGWGLPFATAGMGATQVVLRKVDGAEILRRVDEHGVTVMCGAPAVVNAILDAAGHLDEVPGRGRTRIVVAGAPPPTRTIERVEAELGWEFIQIYGLTETAPLLTMNRTRAEWDGLDPAERARRLGRQGAPALGVRMGLTDQGELTTRTNHVMDGYWEQPEATGEAIVDGWFHTGDGGTIDDDGYTVISDRRKDVIISGGENVSSIEVEDALFSHPAVAEAAVIGVPDERWGELVLGLIVLADGASATEDELREHCRSKLAGYKVPKRIELRTELARTATGKLQKFKLRSPYWEGRERQVN
ncbi:AMP-binding protein [Iamia sp.]|uniref:AMP-binding protein n=1 Tax=Iamia sp. TaxID=2722710 RepID=UPI002CF6CC7B|nr:AMP-binding protein [Iamia sp.]HXH57476.1 AMP-binding protein [Iamia sp.]